MATGFASSGTLISSTLEGVGYHFQAELLDKLTAPFSGSVGAFIYLIGIIVALTSWAIYGQYKFSKWLVLGPVLFFAVITTRSEVDIPHWEFAGEQRNEESRQETVDTTVCSQFGESRTDCPEDNLKKANVASLFAGYNEVVSEVIQELSRLITDTRTNVDSLFLLRAQFKGYLENSFLDDPGLRDLIHAGFLRSCSEAVPLIEPTLSQSEGKVAIDEARKKEVLEKLDRTLVPLSDGMALRYIAGQFIDYGDPLWAGPANGMPVDEWMRQIKAKEASIPAGPSDPNERVTKLNAAEQTGIRDWLKANKGRSEFNCNEIWGFARAGIYRHAYLYLEKLEKEAEKRKASVTGTEISKDEELRTQLLDDLLRTEGFTSATFPAGGATDQKAMTLVGIISKRIFQNEVQKGSRAAFLTSFIDHSHQSLKLRNGSDDAMFETDRALRRNGAWSEKSKAFIAAANLPYYQGLILYFLALSFPLFALLLLVPGKHMGFFYWFLLWFWVKFWQVGFVVVMCLDDILFKIMGQGLEPLDGSIPGSGGLADNIPELIATLREADSSFSPGTYYAIIAVALTAIPAFTSQFILGGLGGGVGAIAAGITSRVSAGVGRAVNYIGGRGEAVSSQMHIDQQRRGEFQMQMAALERNISGAMQGVSPPPPEPGTRGGTRLPQGERLFSDLSEADLDRSTQYMNYWRGVAQGLDGVQRMYGDGDSEYSGRARLLRNLAAGAGKVGNVAGKPFVNEVLKGQSRYLDYMVTNTAFDEGISQEQRHRAERWRLENAIEIPDVRAGSGSQYLELQLERGNVVNEGYKMFVDGAKAVMDAKGSYSKVLGQGEMQSNFDAARNGTMSPDELADEYQ